MFRRFSSSNEPILTLPKALMGLISLLTVIIGVLTVRYVNKIEEHLPITIENEINKKLPEAIKKEVPVAVKEQLTAQLLEQFKSEIKSQTDTTKMELFDKQETFQKRIEERIQGLYTMLGGDRKALGKALKNSVSGDQLALRKTLSPGRELLEYAKAKALAVRSKETAPIISQEYFDEISKYLFRDLEDPDLNTELWINTLQFASYKTVANGVEYGFPKPNRYSGYDVFIGDEDQRFDNAVFVDANIVLRENCPVNLRNVRFVNCTFDVLNEPRDRMLLRKLLVSNKPTITYVIPPPPGYVKGGCHK